MGMCLLCPLVNTQNVWWLHCILGYSGCCWWGNQCLLWSTDLAFIIVKCFVHTLHADTENLPTPSPPQSKSARRDHAFRARRPPLLTLPGINAYVFISWGSECTARPVGFPAGPYLPRHRRVALELDTVTSARHTVEYA